MNAGTHRRGDPSFYFSLRGLVWRQGWGPDVCWSPPPLSLSLSLSRGVQQAKEGGEDRGEEHDSVASREVAANVRTQKNQGGTVIGRLGGRVKRSAWERWRPRSTNPRECIPATFVGKPKRKLKCCSPAKYVRRVATQVLFTLLWMKDDRISLLK